MEKIKYVGIDLHQSTCLMAVHDEHGNPVMESIVETRAETLREFFHGQIGSVHVAFEAKEAIRKDPMKTLYRMKLKKGIRPDMATLSIARKIAAITLVVWKRGEKFSTAKMISSN